MEEIYFSAHQEEKLFNKYLNKDPNKELGTYIDIGASQPIEINNTYYYYLRGWSGLLIEPHPHYIPFNKEKRPNDIYEQIAITNYDGELEMISTTVASSILGQCYKQEMHDKNAYYKVKCMTINSLIKKYPQFTAPDIVSIDVETHEDKILSSTDFHIFRPKILLIEFMVRSISYKKNWVHYLLQYYDFKEDIGANALYVRKS